MKPYKNFRLTDWPDVVDIHTEARKSIIGRIDRDHGYIKNKEAKAQTRRNLKRGDKGKTNKWEENNNLT